jgi:hypothetical protein
VFGRISAVMCGEESVADLLDVVTGDEPLHRPVGRCRVRLADAERWRTR